MSNQRYPEKFEIEAREQVAKCDFPVAEKWREAFPVTKAGIHLAEIYSARK